MTDERFNHLEAQITELRELVRQSTTTTHQNTAAIQQNVTAVQQNTEKMQQDLNSMREDMNTLRERVDLIDGTVAIEIRKGFNSLRNDLDDLSLDKLANNRNILDEDLNQHRLNQRIPAFDKREDD